MSNQIFYFFYNFAHRSDFFDHVVVFFAVWFPYLVIILAGLFLLFHHEVIFADNPYQVFMQKKKEILMVFLSGILAYIAASILKFLISLPRPFDALNNVVSLFPETGHTFPSGHAAFFMALATSIFLTH